METIEPSKYLASLIAAVNDGAKSAQAGAPVFTLVGLYLLATAVSTTDEDIFCAGFLAYKLTIFIGLAAAMASEPI